MDSCKYTREQLIAALQKQYEYILHDDYDPDEDLSPEQNLEYLQTLSLEELIKETDTEDEYPLDVFMRDWSP